MMKTDWKGDELAESMNGKRQFLRYENENGTESFLDVSEYKTIGDDFGASQMNEFATQANSLLHETQELEFNVAENEAIVRRLSEATKKNADISEKNKNFVMASTPEGYDRVALITEKTENILFGEKIKTFSDSFSGNPSYVYIELDGTETSAEIKVEGTIQSPNVFSVDVIVGLDNKTVKTLSASLEKITNQYGATIIKFSAEYSFSLKNNKEISINILNSHALPNNGNILTNVYTKSTSLIDEVEKNKKDIDSQNVHFATDTSFELETAKGGIRLQKIEGGMHKSANICNVQSITATRYQLLEINLKAGTYSLSADVTTDAGTEKTIVVGYTALMNGTQTFKKYMTVGKNATTTFDTTEDTKCISFYSADSSSASTGKTATYSNIMLNEGTEPLPYEQYGLRVAGDMGLVDLTELSWTYNNGDSAKFWITSDIKNLIKKGYTDAITPNVYSDKYTFVSYNGRNHINGFGFLGTDGSLYIYGLSSEKPSGKLAYEVADGATPSQYCEVIKEHGKNLYDSNLSHTFHSSTGNVETNYQNLEGGIKQCEYSQTVTIKCNAPYSTFNVRIHFFKDNVWQSSVVSTNGTGYVSAVVPNGCNGFADKYYCGANAQLLKESDLGDVIIYTESKTVFVPLPQPLAEGDSISEKGEYHEKGYKDLGTLTGWQGSSVNGRNIVFTTLPNAKRYGTSEIAEIISAKYKTVSYNTLISENGGDKLIAIVNSSGSVVIYDSEHTSVPTSSDNWVNGIIVSYAIKNPTITPLTAEQKIALNSVESYEGQTYISTADALAEITVGYGKSDTVATALGADNQSKINEVQIEESEEKSLWKQIKIGTGYKLYRQGNVYLLNLSAFTDTMANLNSALSEYITTTEFRTVMADASNKKAVVVTLGTSGFQVIDIESWSYITSYTLNGQLQWIK